MHLRRVPRMLSRRSLAIVAACSIAAPLLAVPAAGEPYAIGMPLNLRVAGFEQTETGAISSTLELRVDQYISPLSGVGFYLYRDGTTEVLDPVECERASDDLADRHFTDCVFSVKATEGTYVAFATDVDLEPDPNDPWHNTWEPSLDNLLAWEIARSEPVTIAFDRSEWEISAVLPLLPVAAVPILCDPLLFGAPADADIDSLPTAYKVCDVMVRTGRSTAALIRALRAVIPAEQWYRWTCETVGLWCPGPDPDDTPDDPPNPPLFPRDSAQGYGTTVDRELWEILMLRNPDLTESSAKLIADACTELVSRSSAAGVAPLVYADDDNACETQHIYVPGSFTPEATDHRVFALIADPARVQQNYLAGEVKEQSLPRDWYSNYPECASSPGRSCDEFPNFATNQGGPGASLQMISTPDNSREGAFFGGFVSACGLESGRSAWDLGDSFLVVPVPQIPNTRVCGRQVRPSAPAS